MNTQGLNIAVSCNSIVYFRVVYSKITSSSLISSGKGAIHSFGRAFNHFSNSIPTQTIPVSCVIFWQSTLAMNLLRGNIGCTFENLSPRPCSGRTREDEEQIDCPQVS